MFPQSTLGEDLKVAAPFPSNTRTTANTLYNDNATAGSAVGVDCRGYNRALVVVDVGAMNASDTLDFSLVESDASDASAAVAVTSATFTQVAAASLQFGAVDLQKRKRYLFVKAVKTGANGAAFYSAHIILGHKQVEPVSNTLAFNL